MHPSRPLADVHRVLATLADSSRPCVLAVVLEAADSTPCPAGSKAIIDTGGVVQGTIGGGWVEAETQRRAPETMSTGRPVVAEFALQGRSAADQYPICGGVMRVLIDPTVLCHREAHAAAAAATQRGERGVLLTRLRGPHWTVSVEFLPEQAIGPGAGFPGAEALREVLDREEARLFTRRPDPAGQALEVFVEPLAPPPRLLIVGGGHIGQAVAAQAHLVGFEILVIDDRPEFTRTELFPEGTATQCGPIGQTVGRCVRGDNPYVVIATRGHRNDADALAACLHAPAAYIGMIGSRRKVATMRHDFVQSGRATPAQWSRIHAPIGLDIGSVTVPEIATSIVAQLVQVRRQTKSTQGSNR